MTRYCYDLLLFEDLLYFLKLFNYSEDNFTEDY